MIFDHLDFQEKLLKKFLKKKRLRSHFFSVFSVFSFKNSKKGFYRHDNTKNNPGFGFTHHPIEGKGAIESTIMGEEKGEKGEKGEGSYLGNGDEAVGTA